MKNTISVLMCAVLISCAQDQHPEPISFEYTELGITVGTDGVARKLNFDKIDDYYQIVSNCVAGEVIPPDFKIITQEDPIIVNGVEVQGATWLYKNKPPVVFIYYPSWKQEGMALAVLSHEIVHVILSYIGTSVEENVSHDSPAFHCAI
jgi:hypothetical protein